MHRSEAEGRFGEAEPAGRSSVCARAQTIGVEFRAFTFRTRVYFWTGRKFDGSDLFDVHLFLREVGDLEIGHLVAGKIRV